MVGEKLLALGNSPPGETAYWELWIKPLRDQPGHSKSIIWPLNERQHLFLINLSATPWQIKIVAFCPEHPKWVQNLWFAPLNETRPSLAFSQGSTPPPPWGNFTWNLFFVWCTITKSDHFNKIKKFVFSVNFIAFIDTAIRWAIYSTNH